MPELKGFSAKWSYVTRRVADDEYRVVPEHAPPAPGRLAVARVVDVNAHDHLEDVHGRRCRIYPDDLVVGVYGSRYATDAYEGYLPEGTSAHLLTAGGLIGSVESAHDALAPPTELEIVGAVAGLDGAALSTESFARPLVTGAGGNVPTLVVIGSSMNAGKTTTVASLVRGLRKAGLRVGAGKVTGSGSGKDRWSYVDAGAAEVLDFLDFGMPSTFGYPVPRLAATMRSIRDGLSGCDVVVLEIADGVLQDETAALLLTVKELADAVVVAAGDPLAAKASVEIATEASLPVAAVSGLLTRSPLASREAELATGLPVLTPTALAGPAGVGLVGPAVR